MKMPKLMSAVAGAAILATSGIAGTAALAWQQNIEHEVYAYTFYSDASHSTVVGYGRTRCDARYDNSGTYYMLSGSHTGHYDQELIAMCVNGVWQPY